MLEDINDPTFSHELFPIISVTNPDKIRNRDELAR